MRPDAERDYAIEDPYDLRRTAGFSATGSRNLTTLVEGGREVWRTMRTEQGPVTWQAHRATRGVRLRAWGPGSAWVIERGADLLGLNDDPTQLEPSHAIVRELQKRFEGMRLSAGTPMFATLVATILGQRVTGKEGKLNWRELVRGVGESAPGPKRLLLPPSFDAIRRLPRYAFHRFGIEAKRANVIQEVSRLRRFLAAAAAEPAPTAFRRLMKIRGVGPWTSALTIATTHGWTDAVPLGDDNLPQTVAYLLAGEREADDRRMVELLAPYEGQRWRVLRMLKSSGVKRPRRGPRRAVRDEFLDYDANGDRRPRRRR